MTAFFTCRLKTSIYELNFFITSIIKKPYCAVSVFEYTSMLYHNLLTFINLLTVTLLPKLTNANTYFLCNFFS